MPLLTNVSGISLPLAVWLASDSYDFFPTDKSISATALLKPIRQTVLKGRLTTDTRLTPDVSDFIAPRLGHSIHEGIERAWVGNYKAALKTLGYPTKLIERIRINPEIVEENDIPIWLEQRGSRDIAGYTISGKFDMVLEGVIQDFKSTSVYSWIKGSKDDDYRLQGSIYRWIHPDKVTADHMNIQFIFTDWSPAQAKQSDTYPQQRVKEHRVELMSLKDTEAWIKTRIKLLESSANLDQDQLPRCTDEELWRGDTAYKYYANPLKTVRSTKNFTDFASANSFKAENGGKGVVLVLPGKVKACAYCAAFPICEQKDEYEHD